jgi:hypothetical protein
MQPYFPANITVCHRCRHRSPRCAGSCACEKSGRDIMAHAVAGDCPLGLHQPSNRGIPLPGDIIEALAKRLGLARLARLWEKRTGRSCGCARRKEWMNGLARRVMRF